MTDREEAAALSDADRKLCEKLENYTGYVGQRSDIVQLTTRFRDLSRQLAAAEADAARLAEALEAVAWFADEQWPVEAQEARDALAAHTARLIDG